APIQTCKYLFEKKVHLIVFFTNNVDFQSIRDIAPSNHNNQNHTAGGPLVEKTRKNACFKPERRDLPPARPAQKSMVIRINHPHIF
ncbi:hypothetical protein, partial [Thalassospira profundimaris]|uniref:hypothetical protein n=1 Tax=Thalassospira profundimaris TaxID=502049 RepID=UPI001C688D1C